MLFEIVHCCSHVRFRLSLWVDHFVKLVEISQFILIKLESGFLFKGYSQSLDVSSSILKRLHLEDD